MSSTSTQALLRAATISFVVFSIAGCRPARNSVSFLTFACSLEGAVWEVTAHDPPRTGRGQACALLLDEDEDGLGGLARVVPVPVEGVDGLGGAAGDLTISFQTRDIELPIRLPVLGPHAASTDELDGAWVTLLDEEDDGLGYQPRGHITLESYEIEEGADDRSTPDRGSLAIDLTGLTYLHQRRGLTTLNGRVVLHGRQAGCFPDLGDHYQLLGRFEPSADNSCDLPLDLAPPPLEDGTPSPPYLRVAVPPETFREGVACGACISLFSIEGATMNLRGRVTDVCTDCDAEEIRIDPDAFARVSGGRSQPTNFIWSYTSCDLTSPVSYRFRDDSSASRVAIQMRDIRHAVETVEVVGAGGEYLLLTREGSWHVGDGLGPGPFDTRVVDIYGDVIEDLAIELRAGEIVRGGHQFPTCFSDEE